MDEWMGLRGRGVASIRRAMHRLRLTPLHPQFFAFRHESARNTAAAKLCTGLVLDVGCGRQPLRAQVGRDCTYVGVDQPATGSRYGAAPAVFANAEALPFCDGVIDTVVCLEVIEHVERPEIALWEARRVLKPGGKLLLSVPFLYPVHDAPFDFRRWTVHGIDLLAQSTGFELESTRAFGGPVQSGVLLLNLALAWSALNARLPWRLPSMLSVAAVVPLLNLLAMLLSREAVSSAFATGYMCVLRAPAETSAV